MKIFVVILYEALSSTIEQCSKKRKVWCKIFLIFLSFCLVCVTNWCDIFYRTMNIYWGIVCKVIGFLRLWSGPDLTVSLISLFLFHKFDVNLKKYFKFFFTVFFFKFKINFLILDNYFFIKNFFNFKKFFSLVKLRNLINNFFDDYFLSI